jgi:hypothetical protein
MKDPNEERVQRDLYSIQWLWDRGLIQNVLDSEDDEDEIGPEHVLGPTRLGTVENSYDYELENEHVR